MSMGKRSFAFVDEHCKEANRSRPRDDKAAGLHAFDGNSVAIIYLIYHRVPASQPASASLTKISRVTGCCCCCLHTQWGWADYRVLNVF